MRCAGILIKQGKLEEAEIKFKELLEIQPRNVFALKGYDVALCLQGKLEKAKIVIEQP